MDCIDIDDEAIFFGQKLIADKGINQVSFVKESMNQLKDRYTHNVDYALLIGILCSLTYEERVELFQKLKFYFKSGAKLVAAALTVEMAEKDFLCAYLLRETAGWGLQYQQLGRLKDAFEEAGWKYQGYFQEEPTKFYEIGIAIA